ncbi:hypothetical protein ACIQB5_31375 [Streptomyces sp. NPDC088560]|uniref:hypothetical protein n=1 Tax=Streptomyces sp. NPDC088560 TaxID=3365868 RepID=UPI0037F93B9E
MTDAVDVGWRADGEAGGGIAPLDRRVFAVAGVVSAVLMALSPRYGFHIDAHDNLHAAVAALARAEHLHAETGAEPGPFSGYPAGATSEPRPSPPSRTTQVPSPH